VADEPKKKWVDPSREAVSMSLRAEKEKTGGRRRLASDLYKIMSSSTKSAGFTLSPAHEDSMDKWSIKLFGFDKDSHLAKDLLVVGLDCVELEMSFPEQYPFEPPFVRVVTPKFQRQTGFVMNGALCMELLTKDGWNPINDIESVIVSIRSLMVVGDGRVKAAVEMGERAYEEALRAGLEREKSEKEEDDDDEDGVSKRKRDEDTDDKEERVEGKKKGERSKANVGYYTAAEASTAYDHLSKFHEEKGWDKSGWWAKRG
jgi:ubiquitin-conjugating enzyme E2 Q